jgi:hypothetical protein
MLGVYLAPMYVVNVNSDNKSQKALFCAGLLRFSRNDNQSGSGMLQERL